MNEVREAKYRSERRNSERSSSERRDPRRSRARWLRSIAIAWLFTAAAATTAGALGGVLERDAHACCPKNAALASAPSAPCQALLPLACCDDTTLPALAPAPPDRSDAGFALLPGPPRIALAPGAAGRFSRHATASSPRSSPLVLSVLLQI